MSLDLVTLALAKKHADNCSPVISAPIYRSEGNKHYINLRELVPNALYSTPKEIILQNSIVNFNLVVLADDGTEQFIYATTRSELFYVSKIGSFLLLYIQGLSYYVQINCRNTATSTDITFNRYVQYLSSSINYEFTPTKDYHPATKKYVDDAVANIDIPEVSVDGFISYAEAQNLTADEKTQARKNIQKYDWRDGVFSNAIKFKYCDMLESINWDVAASMPDALGFNNNIVDYMAQMTKLLFESLPTANNDTMVKNIVTNYKALREADGLTNSSLIIGFPDNDDNLGFSINMYPAYNDANKITIEIYDNNIHSNVKTGYWIANSDGTVTKSISTINLDATLSKESFYADAKAVGDRLAALEARIAALEGNAQQS